ncbi:MAG: protein phosphatase, partial [Myxococcales bacterium]
MLRFAATGTTHVGLVRPTNQDSALITPELLLVADGVGGGAAGEVASATTTHAVLDALQHLHDDLPPIALASAVHHAQERIGRAIEADPSRDGMATTLTAVLVRGAAAAMVHLGDSRAYVQRGRELIQITRYHTWTQRAVQRGSLSEDDA